MATDDASMAFWYFKSGDPWSQESNDRWVKYRDTEMQILEDAYQQGKDEVVLDKYRINPIKLIQFNRFNPSKQRPIKRQLDCNELEYLREERFFSPPLLATAPSYVNALAWCPFLIEWLKSSAGRRAIKDFSSSIDACINGILEEAKKYQGNNDTEAQLMVEQLRACKSKPRSEVSKTCIYLYTRESFLYHVLNTALRNTDYSKLHTLGPLCSLIRDYSRTFTEFIGTVYRGVQLPAAAMESYKNAIGSWRTWPSYTSASKNRKMADFRGNTLFIIEITNTPCSSMRAYDISAISHFPNEEEVLLLAGNSFQIFSVEQDLQQKCIINIKL